jgi:DHA1 family bicyclomycin/chloramphenicol resistance-like MFS transporter
MTAPAAPQISRPAGILPILAISASAGVAAALIYTPSIPDMAREFGRYVGDVQLTLTFYVIAFGACQLVHGPLSDRYGRRRLLLIGLALFAIGSLLCLLANDVPALFAARFVQAVGACAGVVVTRAAMRDLYGPVDAARALSIIAIAIAISPMIAPTIGGFLHVHFGWRASFELMALIASVLCALVWWRMPETNAALRAEASIWSIMTGGFRLLIKTRRFYAYAATLACAGGGFFGFMTGAPVVMIDLYGLDPDEYGMLTAFPSIGFVCGSVVSNRLTTRLGVDRLVAAGTMIQLVGGILAAAIALYGWIDIMAVFAPMFIYAFGNGLVIPNAMSASMNLHPGIAGAAAALSGFAQMTGASLGSAALSWAPKTSSLPLGLTLLGVGLFSFAMWRLFGGQKMAGGTMGGTTKS